MTIKSSKELVNDALKEIKTISHTEASKLHKDGSCNLIDIRDVRELEKEGIPYKVEWRRNITELGKTTYFYYSVVLDLFLLGGIIWAFLNIERWL